MMFHIVNNQVVIPTICLVATAVLSGRIQPPFPGTIHQDYVLPILILARYHPSLEQLTVASCNLQLHQLLQECVAEHRAAINNKDFVFNCIWFVSALGQIGFARTTHQFDNTPDSGKKKEKVYVL